jgi:hypothetical protein
MTNKLGFIPYFLAILVAVIIIFCVALWRQIAGVIDHSADEDEPDSSTRLVLGLLLVAVFGLGAFLMYSLLHIG